MYRLVYVYLCLFLHSPAYYRKFWSSLSVGKYVWLSSFLSAPPTLYLSALFALSTNVWSETFDHHCPAVSSSTSHGCCTVMWLSHALSARSHDHQVTSMFFIQVGNCVAKRNYRYFYLFLVTITIGCIYVMGCNVAVIVIGECWQDKQTNKQTSNNKVFTPVWFSSLFSFERG